MIVTEKQAARIVCPFARGFQADASHNDPKCIGQRCMSWDWVDPEYIYAQRWVAQQLGIVLPEEIKPGEGEDWYVLNDAQAIAAGWEVSPHAGNTKGSTRYRRLHPARTGQCGRTPVINVERE